MAAPALNIRKATPDDVPVLLPLIQAAYRGQKGANSKAWTTEGEIIGGTRIDATELTSKITNPAGTVLIVFPATPSPTPVACCEIVNETKEEDKVATFGLFAVDPHQQGGGLGRAVLEAAEKFAREEWGAATMEIHVIMTREEIIAWYVRRGYKHTGGRKEFPYGNVANGTPLRDDLYFEVLRKPLV